MNKRQYFHHLVKVSVDNTKIQLYFMYEDKYDDAYLDSIDGIIPEFFNADQNIIELKEENKPLQIFQYKGFGRYSSINDCVHCITFELE